MARRNSPARSRASPPAPIASRLKQGEKTIADDYAEVTVLFADVSGFTAMAETLDAEEVTEIINALWARLDEAITLIRRANRLTASGGQGA